MMNTKSFSRTLLWLGMGLFVLVLAACVVPVSPPAPAADAPEPAAKKIIRVRSDEKELSVGFQPWCSANFPVATLVFMNLVHWKSDGTVGQGLALSWEANADFSEWTFHLDPAALFHDGTPITAQAVKEAYEVGYRLDIQCSWGGMQGWTMANVVGSADALAEATNDSYPDIPGIVVVDDHTITFKLTYGDLSFPGAMADRVAGVFNAKQFKNDHDNWIVNPIGSGAYKVVDMDAQRAAYKVVRAETWWRADPNMDEFEVVGHVDPQTSLLMYKNDEIDLQLTNRIDMSQVFGTDIADQWWPNPYSSNWFTFMMWQDKPPFDDLLVRKAFVHALDYEAAFNAVFSGFPAAEPHTQILPPQYECYTKKNPWQFDPELARQELAESSYGGPEGLPTVSLVYNASDVLPPRLAQIYQKMWEDNLGVKVELLIRQPGDNEIFNQANIRRMSDGYSLNSANWFLNQFRSEAWGVCSQEGTRACTRLSGQPLPEFYVKLDEMLIEASTVSTDDPEYCATWSAVEDVLNDNFHYLPGYNLRYGWLVKPWIKGMSGSYNTEEIPTILTGEFDIAPR